MGMVLVKMAMEDHAGGNEFEEFVYLKPDV